MQIWCWRCRNLKKFYVCQKWYPAEAEARPRGRASRSSPRTIASRPPQPAAQQGRKNSPTFPTQRKVTAIFVCSKYRHCTECIYICIVYLCVSSDCVVVIVAAVPFGPEMVACNFKHPKATTTTATTAMMAAESKSKVSCSGAGQFVYCAMLIARLAGFYSCFVPSTHTQAHTSTYTYT